MRDDLYEIVLGLGRSLDEAEEKRRFLDDLLARFDGIAFALAEKDAQGSWSFLSRPQGYDWPQLWPHCWAAAPDGVENLPTAAYWSVPLRRAGRSDVTVHLFPLGDFGLFALATPSPLPPRFLDEFARVLECHKRAIHACRQHARLTELLHIQQSYERIFENLPQAFVLCDAQTRILDVNPAFERITGFGRDEVLGKTPQLLRSGRHEEAFYAAMWQALRETGRWQGEIWNRRKNGEIYPELLTIIAIPGEEGEIRQYVGLFQDIGSIKARERELEALHAQVQRDHAYL